MRKGYISISGLHMIQMISLIVEGAEKVPSQSILNTENVFFTSFYQAGLDRIAVPKRKHKYLPTDNFAQKLLFFENEDKISKRREAIHEVFCRVIPNYDTPKKEYIGIYGVEKFIYDLITAMDCKSVLICITKKPDIDNLREKMPSELYVPIKNLFDCIEEVPAKIVSPKYVIDAENIERFEDIILSKSFAKYRDAHNELESYNVKNEKALINIYKKGKALVDKNIGLLRVKHATISLLSITPKIIDAIFGKLPGVIADYLGESGTSFLENNKKLSIYSGDNILRYIILNTLKDFKE